MGRGKLTRIYSIYEYIDEVIVFLEKKYNIFMSTNSSYIKRALSSKYKYIYTVEGQGRFLACVSEGDIQNLNLFIPLNGKNAREGVLTLRRLTEVHECLIFKPFRDSSYKSKSLTAVNIFGTSYFRINGKHSSKKIC